MWLFVQNKGLVKMVKNTGCILMKVQKYELPKTARMQPVSCYWYQIFTLPMTFDIMFPKIPILNSKNLRMGRKIYPRIWKYMKNCKIKTTKYLFLLPFFNPFYLEAWKLLILSQTSYQKRKLINFGPKKFWGAF